MSSLFHLSAKESLSCLRYIAAQRVQGKEWEEITQDLEQSGNEVRRFVFQNEQVFRACLKKAHQDQKHLCYSVAYEVLRQQTASKNEKISHSSACMLLRMKLSDDRIRLKKLQEKMRAQAEAKKKLGTSPPLQQPTEVLFESSQDQIETSLPSQATIWPESDLQNPVPTVKVSNLNGLEV